jgi:hypothetical protein
MVSQFAASHSLPAGFPSCFSGIQLSFLNLLPHLPEYRSFMDIPSSFWASTPTILQIPSNPAHRRSLLFPVVAPFFPEFVGVVADH